MAVELKPLAPREAIDYFRAKGFRPSFAWQDVWQAEHARYFTVAKAMQADVLADIGGAVDRALAEGRTLAQFREELEPLLRDKGWWGRSRMPDPVTGRLRSVQLGSPRRLRTIFDVNLRTSYAAGRWAQMQRTRAQRPYLMYMAVRDQRTRPAHRAWHGTIQPMDHPWGRTHFPPNGWNCRCTVRQLSAREAAARGGETEAPPTSDRDWINPRTGETLRVPEGIDPGWGYHVGQAAEQAARDATLETALAGGAARGLLDKLASADAAVAHEILRQVVTSRDFAAQLRRPAEAFPVLRLPDAAAGAIGARNPVAVLSPESLTKNLREHPDIGPAQYRLLPELGASPDLIVQDGDLSVVIVRRGQVILWAAVKATRTGKASFVTSFRRTHPADIRRLLSRGKVIFGKWEE